MSVDWDKYDFPRRPEPDLFNPLFEDVCDYLRSCYGVTWVSDYFCNFMDMIPEIRKKFKSLSIDDLANFSLEMGQHPDAKSVVGLPTKTPDELTLWGRGGSDYRVPSIMAYRYINSLNDHREASWHVPVIEHFYRWYKREDHYKNMQAFIEEMLSVAGKNDDQVIRDLINKNDRLLYALEQIKERPEYGRRSP